MNALLMCHQDGVVHTIHWMSNAILCVSVYLCLLLLKKGNDTDFFTQSTWASYGWTYSTHFCFTRNLSASLVEVTHQYTPLIQDIHDTVSWYHWCHMIICDINVHRTYVDLQFCLCGLCTYVCMFVFHAESYIKLKHHEHILWYYLKAPFSQAMLYLWCDLLNLSCSYQ